MIKSHLLLILIIALVFFISPEKAPKSLYQLEPFRIATYNIRHGLGSDNIIDLNRIAELINEWDIDVVFLTEVDNQWKRSGHTNQAFELSRLTNMPHFYYAPAIRTSEPYSEYGNLFLSKVPIKDVQNISLPQFEIEPRNLVCIQIEIAETPITIWGTHLSVYPSERNAQILSITEYATPKGLSFLLGDFNTQPHQGEILPLLNSGWKDTWDYIGIGEGLTYPSYLPESRIDYIFSSTEVLSSIRSINIVQSPASDHLPVIIEIDPQLLAGASNI